MTKILWHWSSPSISIHTDASLNSFQSVIASVSISLSNLAFPEVNEKESRFPTAGLLGIWAGKIDNEEADKQLGGETLLEQEEVRRL